LMRSIRLLQGRQAIPLLALRSPHSGCQVLRDNLHSTVAGAMREPLLGYLNAWPLLKWWLHPTSLAMALMLIGSASEAQTVTAPPFPSRSVSARSHPVMPVPGWIQFCKQRPEECVVNASEAATIPLTPQAWETLVRINRQVNATIKPMTDLEHWGVEDHWGLAEDGYGDCEDYQLVKRERLVATGSPRRALHMTAVIDEDGEPHAVLMVRTDRGDFILDNKRDAVLPWRRTGYTYLQRESGTGSIWVSLGGVFALPVATAGR
jgi:predicted transglutaminase-like cysteine proteinase